MIITLMSHLTLVYTDLIHHYCNLVESVYDFLLIQQYDPLTIDLLAY